MCAFLGLAVVIVATAFMLQVDTVASGAPEVCEAPCGDETRVAEVPGGPMPGPLLEPFDPVGIEPVAGPEGAPMGPVEAQLPAAADTGTDVTTAADRPAAADVEGEAEEAESSTRSSDEVAASGQAQEVGPGPPAAIVERRGVVDDPASAERESEATAEATEVEPSEVMPESIADTTADAAEPDVVDTEGGQESPLRPAVATAPEGPQLLPTRMRVSTPRGGLAVARGALGYRVPLVVRQRVPAQIRGSVYIPAHETYVVLQPGYWEAVGTAEDPAAVSEPAEAAEPAKGCWLRRLFGKLGRCDGGS